MFIDNLSLSLMLVCDVKKISQAELAKMCGISTRFLSKVICKRSVPTINSLEKICNSLSMTPNELLINSERNELHYRYAKRVVSVCCYNNCDKAEYHPVCPMCSYKIDREYQAFCDKCGQKLEWSQYPNKSIISSE